MLNLYIENMFKLIDKMISVNIIIKYIKEFIVLFYNNKYYNETINNRIKFKLDINDKYTKNLTKIMLPSHPYHLVDQSPWPITLAGVLLSLTLSGVLSFHGYPIGNYLLWSSLILLNWGMALWFKDIITEASFIGYHTDKVQKGISLGVALFIVSEVFFFLSIFWAYFHSSLAPAIEIGSEWPPKGIEPVNASEVPTANTTLLLSSGSAVTVSHHSLVDRLIDWTNNGSVATLIMAVMFTVLQGLEYFGGSFTIADSVFGSVFYLGTGLIYGGLYCVLLINRVYFYSKDHSIRNLMVIDKNLLNSHYKYKTPSPYWITGFSDGESTFSIRICKDMTRKSGWGIKPIFSIELHRRDLHLLERIQKFFKVGKITFRTRNNNVIYSVQSIKDINDIIIPHFLSYPLLTEKEIDFNIFCRIMDLINEKKHLNVDGIVKIINLRASMNKKFIENLIKDFLRPSCDSSEKTY